MSVVAMESYCKKTAVSFLSQNYWGCFRYLALLKKQRGVYKLAYKSCYKEIYVLTRQ